MRRIRAHQRPWYCVQNFLGQVFVVEQVGDPPTPAPTEVLVIIIACGLCGADPKAITGEKATRGDKHVHCIPGHEAVARIVAVGSRVKALAVGDVVVVAPHVYADGHAQLPGHEPGPGCIGAGCSSHMGWDRNGTFTDYALFPATNLIRVDRKHLRQAAQVSPLAPPEAVFAWTEPLACVLTFVELMKKWFIEFNGRVPRNGKAAVVGVGPVGLLIARRLAAEGWKVTLIDQLPERLTIARDLLGAEIGVSTSPSPNSFDLVVLTSSNRAGIDLGKGIVRPGGMLYLFAGLTAADRETMDPNKVVQFENVHRRAQALKFLADGKSIILAGHSGYRDAILTPAIEAVAKDGALLGRAVTGVILGWKSDTVLHRWPGGAPWTTSDGSPAIAALLQGMALHKFHMKLMVITRIEALARAA